jgi:hypothetical protein
MSGSPQALTAFETGMREAFLASFALTIIAAIVSAKRPKGNHFNIPSNKAPEID